LDDLLIAGYDDPLEGPSGRIEARPLELTDARFAEEARAFVSWFSQLPRRPDVVIVHQHGLAHALLDTVRRDGPPLLILTGHDHKQHLERNGAAVLVDGGTAGAGGPFAIGEQPVGFAEVRFTDAGVARTVDLIDVEPLSGDAVARRIAIDDDG
jgi:hypothetical protein